MLQTMPPVTWASAGAIRPPTRPLAKFSAPIRKISVMKLNASVNGGTLKAPMKTLASAACRIVENAAPTTIQTITRRSQSGCRNSESPAPTSTPLKPNRPARIAPRSIPITIAATVETATPSAPAKPSHGSAMNIATRIASPVTGLFMKHTWPTPRRQESTNSTGGLPSMLSDQPGIVPLTDTASPFPWTEGPSALRLAHPSASCRRVSTGLSRYDGFNANAVRRSTRRQQRFHTGHR